MLAFEIIGFFLVWAARAHFGSQKLHVKYFYLKVFLETDPQFIVTWFMTVTPFNEERIIFFISHVGTITYLYEKVNLDP